MKGSFDIREHFRGIQQLSPSDEIFFFIYNYNIKNHNTTMQLCHVNNMDSSFPWQNVKVCNILLITTQKDVRLILKESISCNRLVKKILNIVTLIFNQFMHFLFNFSRQQSFLVRFVSVNLFCLLCYLKYLMLYIVFFIKFQFHYTQNFSFNPKFLSN